MTILSLIEKKGKYSFKYSGKDHRVTNLDFVDGVYCYVCGAPHLAKREKKIRFIDLFGWRISMFKLRR
jgi:hypothetical protein